MINTNLLSSIFEAHNVDSVYYLKDEENHIFLIEKMKKQNLIVDIRK